MLSGKSTPGLVAGEPAVGAGVLAESRSFVDAGEDWASTGAVSETRTGVFRFTSSDARGGRGPGSAAVGAPNFGSCSSVVPSAAESVIEPEPCGDLERRLTLGDFDVKFGSRSRLSETIAEDSC